MTPEAEDYLRRRESISTRLGRSPGSAWPRPRPVCLLRCISCCQSFIVEHTGRIAKSHSGVRSAFARLAKETSGDGPAFSTFLAQAYLYKEIADYGVGGGVELTMAEANNAIAMAERFIGWAVSRA